MLFNSMQFLIFFPIVVLAYFIIPDKIKYLWLLAASYFFYMCWNAKFALLILFSTVVTYLSGLCIEHIKQSAMSAEVILRNKKIVVAISFTLNLLVLFYFKYFDFVLSVVQTAFALIHVELNIPAFDIMLPVGISFYTFQALSYTMDVYRDEIYAEKNFFRYALFVSFFPQLVAGPIERSKNLLKQLNAPKKFNFEAAREGVFLMLWGFFLKIVLADRIAVFVDAVYGDYTTYTGFYLIVATLLFSVQIYCDFYGYSIIAIGSARILGITLMENFQAPYLSTSVQSFWKKWHISLTSWFRDYLYIPLGGSRKGALRKNVNKMTVFLVSGLWHGASMKFVIWGALNGAFQIIGEQLQPARDFVVKKFHLNRQSFAHKFAKGVITFLLVSFTWVFFRASSTWTALVIIQSMVTDINPWILFDDSLYTCGLDAKNFVLLIVCIVVLMFADFAKQKGVQIHQVIIAQDYWFRCLFITFAVGVILVFGLYGPSFDSANFIYFQF